MIKSREQEREDERATCALLPSTRPFLVRRRGGHSPDFESGRGRGRTLPALSRTDPGAGLRWDETGPGEVSGWEKTWRRKRTTYVRRCSIDQRRGTLLLSALTPLTGPGGIHY